MAPGDTLLTWKKHEEGARVHGRPGGVPLGQVKERFPNQVERRVLAWAQVTEHPQAARGPVCKTGLAVPASAPLQPVGGQPGPGVRALGTRGGSPLLARAHSPWHPCPLGSAVTPLTPCSGAEQACPSHGGAGPASGAPRQPGPPRPWRRLRRPSSTEGPPLSPSSLRAVETGGNPAAQRDMPAWSQTLWLPCPPSLFLPSCLFPFMSL